MNDCRGNPVQTRSGAALDHAERALWRLMTFYGTPLDDLEAAQAADPQWVMPALMKAGFLLGLSEAGFAREGRAVLDAIAPEALASASEREQAHHRALRELAAGRWDDACASWGRLLERHPRDALALQWAHLFDFYRGDAANLCQRAARVLPAWDAADPLHPHVLAIHAFGLEEAGHYAEAEATGRRALDGDPKAPWAVHAVAHVMEMQGRHDEGSHWLRQRRPQWSVGNGFAVHLGWHQALFALERLDGAEALALLDEHMAADRMTVTLERLDAAALLWRLHLLGMDVGPRWRELLEAWDPSPAEAGHYAFNDWHALLVMLGAGEAGRAQAWLQAAERQAASGAGTNRAMAEQVGLPLMRGACAFAQGRAKDALGAIAPVRAVAHRFGGSHAQRDLIDQTVMAAAAMAGERSAGLALLDRREAGRGTTPLNARWRTRFDPGPAARVMSPL